LDLVWPKQDNLNHPVWRMAVPDNDALEALFYQNGVSR
jgi:hypothetical protein